MKKYSLIVFLGTLILLYVLRNYYLHNYYGLLYNSDRGKIGLILINDTWEEDRTFGANTTYWRKPDPDMGHFKKVMEFGLIRPKIEKDYYKQFGNSDTYVFSKYRFEDDSFTYFSITNNKPSTIGITGKSWWPTVTKQIEKSDFEEFIKESKTTANTK